MKSIKCKNTKPEMSVRRELHSRGYRYKTNDYGLPGRPDIVLSKYNAVIFVNGCYWHAHDCDLFKIPKSNRDFWLKKFSENVKRDAENIFKLKELGWRIGIVWECALRMNSRNYNSNNIIGHVEKWIKGSEREIEISKTEVNFEIFSYASENLEVLAS